jgi:hypothetical protein
MTTAISKYHPQTCDARFRSSLAADLHRADVTTVPGEVTQVSQGHNGTWKVTHHGQTVIFPAFKHKADADREDNMKIRRFLKQYNSLVTETPAHGCLTSTTDSRTTDQRIHFTKE